MANQNDPNTKQLMKMYSEYGLSEPFAMAIVEGKDSKAVMEFWNQDWHKQYPDADDVLVIAVLEQTITPEEGEWLNSVRSNHEALVQSCLDGSVTIEWAKSLMHAGFLNHSKEVSDILKGGDPIVIAMLSGIEVESDLLPPKLKMKTKNTDFLSNGIEPLNIFGDHRGKNQTKTDKENLESSLTNLEKPSHIECSNCKALVTTSVTSCPHCKFQLVWEWELLMEAERSYLSFFMMHYLPGISYENAHVFSLMRVLSTMQETISLGQFWNGLKSIRLENGRNNLVRGMKDIALEDATFSKQRRAVPSMGNQHFTPRVWIQGMIHASKFWGRV